MNEEAGRIEALERRLADVERRLASIEASPTATAPTQATGRMTDEGATTFAASAPSSEYAATRPSSASAGGGAAVPGWVPPSARPGSVPVARTITSIGAEGTPDVEAAPGASADRPRRVLDRDVLAELEERLTGRLLAWAGGVALVLGALFFLSLAFSRGWIGPEGRVLIGLAAGTAALLGGGALLARGDRLVGHVLTPVGLAVVSISLVAATRLYGLVPTEVGLAGALLSAIVAAVIAIRADSQSVAAFGLVSVLLAPPLVGASADVVTLAFVGAALVGTTSISIWRTWTWLPPIAFALSAPQAAAWFVGDPPRALALVGLATFWALHAVAAGGEEFRRRRDDLQLGSGALLLANAAFTVWAGFTLLGGDLIAWRGAFLLVLAAAHVALGLSFLLREGDRDVFGLLAAGTGVAVLAMAAPVQLDAAWVPVAWAAEAAALAWIAVQRRHPIALAASAALFGLAGLAVAVDASGPLASGPLDPRIVSLVAFLVPLSFAALVVRERWLRALACALGLTTTSIVVVAVLPTTAAIGALALLVVAGAGLERLVRSAPDTPIDWQLDGLVPASLRSATPRLMAASWALPVGVAVPALLAVVESATRVMPVDRFGQVTPPAVPFSDTAALVAAILIGAALAAGYVSGLPVVRRGALLVAAGVAVYAIPYEVYARHVAILWVALAAGLLSLVRLDPAGRRLWLTSAAALLGGAAFVAVAIVAPPTRLVVSPDGLPLETAIWSAIALASVAAGLGALAIAAAREPTAWAARLATAVAVVYLVSVAIVDAFSVRVPAPIALEELQKQAQVALSVAWAVLGVAWFVAGLRLRRLELRQAGLALLALASLKVFLFDLSALDVAYRVISLIALGLLLLTSAWVYGRLRPKPAADEPLPDGGPEPGA
ncbi:MAG TPA: DUF2339 domain-containing protein [Candidatus Dormibacteraeota bacterium]|nr:DUF2339 domain-containing protein [Candidatus Dormibacteraeota bacterium]